MTRVPGGDITLLLKAWAGGNDSVLDELIPVVYDELRRLAHKKMSHERAGHTLQSDALVNEAFLRFINARQIDWQDRAHFFAFFANMMRRILVDHARSRCRIKRGGAHKQTAFDSSVAIKNDIDARISSMDDALNVLAKKDSRKAKIVEMHYYGGFSVEEIAGALGISPRTVMNDLKFSRSWLLRELESK